MLTHVICVALVKTMNDPLSQQGSYGSCWYNLTLYLSNVGAPTFLCPPPFVLYLFTPFLRLNLGQWCSRVQVALGVFCHLNHHRILLCAKLGSGGVERVRLGLKVTSNLFYAMIFNKGFLLLACDSWLMPSYDQIYCWCCVFNLLGKMYHKGLVSVFRWIIILNNTFSLALWP